MKHYYFYDIQVMNLKILRLMHFVTN